MASSNSCTSSRSNPTAHLSLACKRSRQASAALHADGEHATEGNVNQEVKLLCQAVLESLLVCGGGSIVPGLPQRILRELCAQLPPSTGPALVQAPEYAFEGMLQVAAWTGGAIISKARSAAEAKHVI